MIARYTTLANLNSTTLITVIRPPINGKPTVRMTDEMIGATIRKTYLLSVFVNGIRDRMREIRPRKGMAILTSLDRRIPRLGSHVGIESNE